MQLPPDSLLNSDNAHLLPKEIFREACRLIGAHYTEQGCSYLRSRPKIVKKDRLFTTEILFNSSHSNMAGRHVCLEVYGLVSSVKLAAHYKASGEATNAYILSHDDFWEQQRFLDQGLRTNCNFNVYGLTGEGLAEIIEYIDRVFLRQIEQLETTEGLLEFIQHADNLANPHKDRAPFYKFIELEFGNDVRIEEALRQKGVPVEASK